MPKEVNLSTFDTGVLQPFCALKEQDHASQRGLSEVGILFALMVFSPLIEGGTTHLPVLIIRLLLVAGLALWVFRSFQSGTITLYRIPMMPLAAMFVGISGLGIFRSSYVGASIQGVIGLLMYALLMFLLLHQLYTRSSSRILVLGIVVMGSLEGLLGIVQYGWMGEARAKGTFFNPNFFAMYEAVTVVLALSLLSSMKWADHGWQEKCLLGAALSVSMPAFVMAQSRGAFFAFLVALLFLGLCRSWKLAVLLPLVVVLGVITLPNPIKERALAVSDQDPYAYTRLEIWKSSLDRIADHPFGTGLGTYKYLSFKYRFPIEGEIVRYEKRAESAHNEYLQMAVELGVGGLALFLVGIGVWGWEVKGTLQGEGLSSWERGAVVGLSGGALAILVHASVDSVFHEPALVILLILCGSLVLVLKRLNSPTRTPTWNIPFPYHPARLALVVLLGAASIFLIIQPAAAWFAYEQGNVASRNGQRERAWEWYRRATFIDPGTTAYRDAVARMNVTQFYASGDPQWLLQAVEEIEICQELNPLDGRIPSRLGMLYLLLAERTMSNEQRGELIARAVKSYEGAIKADPFSPFNYQDLGKIMWRQGQYEEAQVLLKKAVSHEPNFLPARVLLAKLAAQVGKNDIALSQYAAIERIQERYKGRTVSPLESRYLDVSLDLKDQLVKE
jgi:O-antigen ligase